MSGHLSMMSYPIYTVFALLLLLGTTSAGNAVCSDRGVNTTDCECADGDPQCSFPSCIDDCVSTVSLLLQ